MGDRGRLFLNFLYTLEGLLQRVTSYRDCYGGHLSSEGRQGLLQVTPSL